MAGDDPRRVEAGILFELNYNLTAGHSFLPEDKLQLAVSQLLSVDGEAVKQGIGRLLERRPPGGAVRWQVSPLIIFQGCSEAEVNCSGGFRVRKGSFPPPKGLERMIRNVGGGKRHRIFRGTDPRHPGSGDLRAAADHRRPRHR